MVFIHIPIWIFKQSLDLSVVGINPWRVCQFLFDSEAAKRKSVKIYLFFLTKGTQSFSFDSLHFLALLLAGSLHLQICAAVLLLLQPKQGGGSFFGLVLLFESLRGSLAGICPWRLLKYRES